MLLTLGDVAARLSQPDHPVQVWQVRRLFERGLLPPARRLGMYRVVEDVELPAVRQALILAGYLPFDPQPTES